MTDTEFDQFITECNEAKKQFIEYVRILPWDSQLICFSENLLTLYDKLIEKNIYLFEA